MAMWLEAEKALLLHKLARKNCWHNHYMPIRHLLHGSGQAPDIPKLRKALEELVKECLVELRKNRDVCSLNIRRRTEILEFIQDYREL